MGKCLLKQMGQRDADRLERCADRHLIKFSKAKCKVLNLGRNKPMQQEQLWPSKGSWRG